MVLQSLGLKKSYYLGFLVSFFTFFSGGLLAIEMPLQKNNLIIYGEEVEVILDKKRQFTIEDLPLANFKKYHNSSPNFGFYDGVVWLRFKVNSKEKRKILLELKNPSLDNVKVFKRTEFGFELIDQVGDDYPFSTRKIKHRYFQIEIELPVEIILQVNNVGNKCYIPIQLLSNEAVVERDYKLQFTWGLYFGLLLFIFFLTLTVYIMLRKKSTVYYLCYLLITILSQISHSGFGKQYLWLNSTFFSNRILPLTGVLASLFLILFARYFLKTKKYSPRTHKYYTVVIVLLIITGIMTILPSNRSYHYASIILNSLLFFACVPIFSISYSAIKRGFKPAQFFFWSISVLVLSVWTFVLFNFGWIPSNNVTSASLQIGTACEVVLLTLAIIQELKSLKERASQTLLRINTMKDKESDELAEKIEIRTKKVYQNKLEIQEKNDKMVTSINYARNIQDILIPKESDFVDSFADGFVLTQAKDIVSGDFYWCANLETKLDDKIEKLRLICVGDCTGHGVPGALISVLGLRLLNSSLTDSNVVNASSTMDYLHNEFIKLFQGQNEDIYIQDGMDCAIGIFNPRTLSMQFAAAKNSLFLVRNGEMIHYKGNKQEIGSLIQHIPYTQVEIQLMKGDRIYMFTDGYSDQFGGEFNKKMKPPKLKELILENHLKPMTEQKSIYLSYFNHWKGNVEQTDDMCIVGLEI